MENYYVYMMTNGNNHVLYTGVTNDLIRRVYEHKNHIDQKSFTARYHVEKLVYYEVFREIKAAIAREKQIKGWNRSRKNKCVEQQNPEWVDLYHEIIG
ncbi:GIY-YIG nuclease family protein [Ruminococcus sp.]|uniref:GIY-YIG nuclease family protein n=1 Tax=Ruminococcus sp. TaxID=41978 RepID=UPI00388EFA44